MSFRSKARFRNADMMPLNNRRQRGAALYVAVMVTSLTLAIAVGVSALLVGQLKILRSMGDSVVAFFAADAGIERILRVGGYDCSTYVQVAECVKSKALGLGVMVLENGSTYVLTVEKGGEGTCPAQKTYCVKSLGTYKNTRRAIRIIK